MSNIGCEGCGYYLTSLSEAKEFAKGRSSTVENRGKEVEGRMPCSWPGCKVVAIAWALNERIIKTGMEEGGKCKMFGTEGD